MAVREYHTVTRKCGKRKPGGCYLVSEPSEDGELDAFTILKTAIPYRPPEGVSPNMRGYILVDISKILEGEPYDEYVLGATAARRNREIISAPETEAFGMPLARRETIGVCRRDGLSALAVLRPMDRRGIGRHLRFLSGNLNALSEAERAKAVRHWQEMNWPATLAALWRMYSKLSPGSHTHPNINNIAMAMTALGASKDAIALFSMEKEQ